MLERRILVMTLICDRKRAMQRLFKALRKSRHSRPLWPPDIMIAAAASGNNNLSDIVTPDHGERPVPRFVFRRDAACYPHIKRASLPRKALKGPASPYLSLIRCKTR